MKSIIEAAQAAQKEIDMLIGLLQKMQARTNLLELQLSFYQEHFGTYEDVQAQAVAPSPDAFDFTPSDLEELNQQDTKLTENQMQAYYNAETHAAYHQNNRNA